MLLQTCIGHRRGDKEYPKHQIVIPNNIIEQLEWNPREHLEPRVTKKGLLIYKTEPKISNKKPDYELFKEATTRGLMRFPKGCTWDELRLATGLPQKTPSPIWTKRMEDEKIITRVRDPDNSKMIWKMQGEYLAAIASTMNGWVSKGKDEASHTP